MNWAQVFGVGGPWAVAGSVIIYLLAYRLKKRGSETGVVETTKATLDIVRGQQKHMAETLASLQTENEDLRSRLRLKDEQVDRLENRERDLAEQVAAYKRENDELRQRLDAIERRAR